MKKLKIVCYLVLFITILFLNGCENPITGYGPQPNYIDEHGHKPFLNIFGILRPETEYGLPLSFIHVEGIFTLLAEYPDTFDIPDAKVMLYEYNNNQISDSINCKYTNFDSPNFDLDYRLYNFYPNAGQTYGISCKKEGYPELTSQTTIPLEPQILANSIQIKESKLTFSILHDSLAALYDIYFQISQKQYYSRILKTEQTNLDVEMDFYKGTETEGTLIIYAYDLNLSKYLTSSVIIKPNTYQEPASTVENGYGSFGSLNIFKKSIIF